MTFQKKIACLSPQALFPFLEKDPCKQILKHLALCKFYLTQFTRKQNKSQFRRQTENQSLVG
jgi:hypothetical protein